jgi:hypothetical protein
MCARHVPQHLGFPSWQDRKSKSVVITFHKIWHKHSLEAAPVTHPAFESNIRFVLFCVANHVAVGRPETRYANVGKDFACNTWLPHDNLVDRATGVEGGLRLPMFCSSVASHVFFNHQNHILNVADYQTLPWTLDVVQGCFRTVAFMQKFQALDVTNSEV